ncbi:hypothetical protein X755_27800 [Mesorhizobium sp. LNJC405B00]|nr:hypothetical protein X755_27800 [Mesorhizobium sp. LNJC405B00]
MRHRAVGLAAETAELLFDLAHEIVVLNVACRHDHHLLGAILALYEIMQLFGGEGFDGFRRAEDRAADRLVAEGGLGETVEDDVVGRVVRGADLLQDHMLLALQFLWVEFGLLQDIGKDIHRQRHIVGQHPGVIGRRLD